MGGRGAQQEGEAEAGAGHPQEVGDKDAGPGYRQARRPPTKRGTVCRARPAGRDVWAWAYVQEAASWCKNWAIS